MRGRVGVELCVYGDPAYLVHDVLLHAPKGRMTSAMEAYATLVSHYRETVEWDFGKMGALWPSVTEVCRKLSGSRATSKEDCVAALLTKYHTCRYGCVAYRYFEILPPSMREHATMYHLQLDRQNMQ